MKKKFFLRGNKLLIALLIAVSSVLAFSAQAQSNKEEVDLYQSLFGAEKKALIAEFLKLESNNPFWSIYDEYETERKQLGINRLKLINDYIENFATLDDGKTDEIVSTMMKQKKSSDGLIDKYYKKIHKASGSKVAAQFYHFENYLLSAIRVSILENIPAIGALDD